ncbi:MAG: hypothetical protein KGL39_39975 [Patescibacteria group bacterium]|nr:hypothetical protein [Patescibacteria group bacterium]
MTTEQQRMREAFNKWAGNKFPVDNWENAAWQAWQHQQAEIERLRAALKEIATGRDASGKKVDFYQDIAQAALNTAATSGQKD